MLSTGRVSASGSQSPGLSPGVSRFSGPLPQGTAPKHPLHRRNMWKTFSRGMLLGEVSH